MPLDNKMIWYNTKNLHLQRVILAATNCARPTNSAAFDVWKIQCFNKTASKVNLLPTE